jgi:hypothetical protein
MGEERKKQQEFLEVSVFNETFHLLDAHLAQVLSCQLRFVHETNF